MKKHFSAHYIFTNTGPPLRRGIITTGEDGTIIRVKDTGGDLSETGSVEFCNGIIIPGFVNCHCHLELSNMKGSIPEQQGLGNFIKLIRSTRDNFSQSTVPSIYSADIEMYEEGIVLCADICNTASSFEIKKTSNVYYINLLEVFGINPEKAERRMDELDRVWQKGQELNLPCYPVPHSAYSLSLPLFRLLKEKCSTNRVTTLHYLETPSERTFLQDHTGPLMESYKESGLITADLETVENHSTAILNEITLSGSLILVHNTYADRESVRTVKQRKNLFWCLCPNSNLYIENRIPPLELLIEEKCEIVIGTDSLASNKRLSIIEELKTLQKYFPSVALEDMVSWATINGAKALGEDHKFGTIEPGKNPGLLLIQDVDLINLKLDEKSNILRLL